MTAIGRVGVVGAGVMGSGIVQLMAQNGLSVLVSDLDPAAAAAAIDKVLGQIARMEEKGRLPAGTRDRAAAGLAVADGIAGLADCDLVVEAVAERLEVKRDLFARLEAVVRPDAILATNTSAISITAIAAACRRPERVAGLHFFNPVPLMRVVEVVAGLRSAPAVLDALTGLCERLGHAPIRCTDSPGFVINHIGRAYYTEALRLLQEKIAEPPAIDAVLREVAGFRMGPFELLDLTGLDVSFAVMEEVYHGFYEEPRLRPTPLPRTRVAAGLFGRKTGEGFYRYLDGARVEPPATGEAAADAPLPAAVWIAPGAGLDTGRLGEALASSGTRLDGGERPGAESALLVPTLGEDATTAALRLGLDPARTVAVDLFVEGAKRIVLMPTPATDPAVVSGLAAALSGGGLAVTAITDGPGFIVQRVLAAIVNLACEAAQQGLATPQDIDRAVQLGLGYPQGPLAWGDRLGPGRILAILRAIHEATGDSRYRPSLWLQRRAALGLSLLAPHRR